ncbi:uncharacterized protein LOC143361278 isoform X2 [Halictus rubicundus]|uniref:uncharacterized protein LOC143361278 isoform X2 n=1 Tax=Halictus rubicundus TaxID=77578 RepID=UPI004035B9C5
MYILSIEKRAPRAPLLKNAKRCNHFKEEEYFDRGDFCDVGHPIGIRGTKPAHFRSTDWSSCTELISRDSRTVRARKDNNQRTARLRCAEGTFRVHNIYGDGNCMFRAISYILWRNEDEHRQLRSMVVQHIKDNWYEYGPFVMAEWNISDRQTYCDYMSTVGTFASELECIVATKINYTNLSIYREIRDRYELKRVFHNHVSSQYETVRLLFTGNSDSGHYDVLIPD